MLINQTAQREGTFGEGELPKFERKNHSSKLRVTDSEEVIRGKLPKTRSSSKPSEAVGSGADGVNVQLQQQKGKDRQGRKQVYKMQ